MLITLPVLCLLALYGFVASITLGSALGQEHATTLRNELADPVTGFQQQVAQERALALLSLANPTNTQVASELGVQESATQHALAKLTAAVQAPAAISRAAAQEHAAIQNLLSESKHLNFIRGDISDDAITMRAALDDYDAIIDAGYPVIDGAVDQFSSVPVVTQALATITLDRASQAAQEEWDLLAGDMAQNKFPNADRLTFAALARQRQSLINAAVPELDPQYRAMLAANVSPATSNAMDSVETAVTDTPWHRGAPPPRLATSKMVFAGYSLALGKALSQAANALQDQVRHNADTVTLQLVLAAGLGLLGTIASIALSLIIGRGLVRQLRGLRESALTLAHEKLPDVIARLRSGEQVDPADYAPAEASTGNEIEQVQNAFSVVQQTAVRAAVDEARLRRGISDVFRNLAGRSQSLLHRQLTLLDGMERRATEPDELEDLFRIDHLTTRMRRHAEGLIILSGDAPARGWRQPVPLVDVLRGAVAEVEDYTRIRVLCRTGAAVAGQAVADVIHLVAELAENATVFSPPNTPVRIQGDVVGRGFAIEIEDRGLGISPARLEEINANLASPPQFDLSGSDRLGLFIAGQLAQRHDIKITLQPSVYGGTTAIVLIPTALVADEAPVERDPVLAAGQRHVAVPERFSGRHAALTQSAEPGDGFGLSRRHGGGLPGNSMSGATARAGLARNGRDQAGADAPAGNGRASAEAQPIVLTPVSDDAESMARKARVAELGLPVRVRQASLAPQLRNPPQRPLPAPTSEPRRDNGSTVPGAGGAVAAPATAAESDTGGHGIPGSPAPGSGSPAPGSGSPAPGSGSPAPGSGSPAPGSGSPAPGPAPATPEAAMRTMSALQRGWQLGRSEAAVPPEGPGSVFTPRRSPSGRTFDQYSAAAGSDNPHPADGGERSAGQRSAGEHDKDNDGKGRPT